MTAKSAFVARQGLWSRLAVTACIIAALVGVSVLSGIVVTMLEQGLGSVNWAFFEKTTPEGGMRNGVLGSLVMVSLATLVGLPIGLAGGIWLCEIGQPGARLVRICLDILAGVPSIVVGILVYAVWVQYFGYSGWAGAVALAIIMVPIVAKTAEEMLRLVPDAYREAAYGLGARRKDVVLSVVLPAAASGLVTGGMLAVARVAGETAPLLFTAGGSSLALTNPREPLSALPLEIYAAATEPSAERIRQGWAGMLVLVGLVLVFNVVVRWLVEMRARRAT